jgi:hypothetical protein
MKNQSMFNIKPKTMITNYENITEGLTQEETKIILPKVVELVRWRRGKENAVTNRKLVNLLTAMGHDVCEPRIRKMINQIRLNGIVKNLLATSKGYYITTDHEEIKNYVKSLRERASAINAIADTFQTN